MRILKIALVAFLAGFCAYLAGFHSWLAGGQRGANPSASERWSFVFMLGAGACVVWMAGLVFAGLRGKTEKPEPVPRPRDGSS